MRVHKLDIATNTVRSVAYRAELVQFVTLGWVDVLRAASGIQQADVLSLIEGVYIETHSSVVDTSCITLERVRHATIGVGPLAVQLAACVPNSILYHAETSQLDEMYNLRAVAANNIHGAHFSTLRPNLSLDGLSPAEFESLLVLALSGNVRAFHPTPPSTTGVHPVCR
jgi:hypothetical protein